MDNTKKYDKFRTILTIIFIPYLGMFILAKKRPFSKKSNKYALIYSIIASIVILFKIVFDIVLYGGIFYKILLVSTIIFILSIRKEISDDVYVRKIIAVLEENYIEDEIILTKKEEEEILSNIIEEFNLKGKLTNFIMLETWRYDSGEISVDQYDNTLNILLDEFFETKGFVEALKEKEIKLDNIILASYIRVVKKDIYADVMMKNLNVVKGDNLNLVLRKYIGYYGIDSLKDINIKTLSVVLGLNLEMTKEYVQREFNQIRKNS